MPSQPFAGRVCLVTGGGHGIGRAFVLELLRQGALVATCDIDTHALAELRTHDTATNARLVALVADLADPLARERFHADVVRELGPVELLVNNAGVVLAGPLVAITAQDWEWIRSINLDAPFDLIRRVLPAMQRLGRGHILNVASFSGVATQPFVSPYVATKHALVGLSRALHGELRDYGIRVTVGCPGPVKTGIFERTRTRAVDLTPVRWVSDWGITPETAARRMLKAVLRGRVLTIPNHDIWLAYQCCRLWPSLADGIVAWAARVGFRKQQLRRRDAG